MDTLIISRRDIEELVDIPSLQQELRQGFIDYSNGTSRRDGKRIVLEIEKDNTATVLGPGTCAGIPAFTIKSNSKFPQEPTPIKGVIALFEIDTGNLLALLDSSPITAIRTGLCAAMATDLLAVPGAAKLGVIGAGKQNMLQLDYLLTLREFTEAVIFDVNESRARMFRDYFSKRIRCEIAGSIADTVADSQVILMATWTRHPILEPSLISAPCHITTLGSDEKGKVEVSRDLVLGSAFFCDDIDLNMAMGTPGNLGLSKQCIAAEIGSVFSDPSIVKNYPNKVTIYSSVGLPFQDLVTSWHVYNKARAQGSVATARMS